MNRIEKCTAYIINDKKGRIQTIEGIQSVIWLNFLTNPNAHNTLYVFGENGKLMYQSARDNYGIPHKCYEDKGKTYNEIFN